MRRRGSQSIVANPTLVGAVTVLVVIVAVFLAYNANKGLPFVPTREIAVDTTSGANLVGGEDVRIGGYRIGVVSNVKPVALPSDKVGARISLKLDRTSAKRIPSDSRATIRLRSSIGSLKYIEFLPGRSSRSLQDGDTLPLRQTTVPVQFDDFYRLFDTPTRVGIQSGLGGFGNAFAGRGGDLGTAVQELPRLFRGLERVSTDLSDPKTGLTNFFRQLNRTVTTVAPLADVLAGTFGTQARTFAALSQDADALRETIARSPDVLARGQRSLAAQRPFLNDTALLARDLRTTASELRTSLPVINPALRTGVPVLRRSVSLNENTQGVLRAVDDLTSDPRTNIALRGLTATVDTLNPQLRYLGPFVTVCNTFNYFWYFTAEHESEPNVTGTAERALLNTAAGQINSVGTTGATHFANAKGYEPKKQVGLSAANGARPQRLQAPGFGAAIDDQGRADCENGQRGYLYRNAPGVDPKYKVSTGFHTPGNQGPLFKTFNDASKAPQNRELGRARVPEGQTFTREPDPTSLDDLLTEKP